MIFGKHTCVRRASIRKLQELRDGQRHSINQKTYYFFDRTFDNRVRMRYCKLAYQDLAIRNKLSETAKIEGGNECWIAGYGGTVGGIGEWTGGGG